MPQPVPVPEAPKPATKPTVKPEAPKPEATADKPCNRLAWVIVAVLVVAALLLAFWDRLAAWVKARFKKEPKS